MTFENLGEMSLSEMIYEEVSGKYPLKLTTVLDTDDLAMICAIA